MLCNAAGMIVLIIFGKFLGALNSQSLGGLPLGFGITFLSAVAFGILSLHFLKKVPEPSFVTVQTDISFQKNITMPLGHPISGHFWFLSFSGVYSSILTAFFTLYLLSVVALQELSGLKELVRSNDSEGFVVVSDTLEVMETRISNQPHW